MKKEDEKS